MFLSVARTMLERYRAGFEKKSEKDQLKFTIIVIMICSLIFAAALMLADYFTGGLTDISKSYSDVSHYFINISDVIDKHLMPYSETPLEYPPFTLVIFLIPKLIAWDWPWYHLAYNVFAGMAYSVFAVFAFKIANMFRKDRYSLFVFVLLLIAVCNLMIYDRNDVFAVLFITLALYLYLKDKHTLAAICIACAAMIKIYPIILVPVFMILFLSKKDWRNTLKFVLVSGLACLLMELPFLIADPSTAFSWVSYHSGRGLQAEGVVSSFIMMINLVIPCIDSIYLDDSKSVSLHGAFPDAVASCLDVILPVMMILALIFMLYRACKAKNKDHFRTLALMSLVMVMTFITFSKVYSAQYSLWILTLIPFIIFPQIVGDSRFYKTVIVFMITSFMSQCVAFAIGSTPVDWLITIIIFAKNLVHLYLYYLVIRMFIDHTRVGDKTESKSQSDNAVSE